MGPFDRRPPAPDGSDVAGQRLGAYVLERRLGAGGMAEVFLAKKPIGVGAFKQVVLKRMRRELVGEERFVEMFLREAGILAQLSHPNVVQIFDLAADDDELYIALEYLDGLSVQDLAVRSARARRPLPVELVLRVVAEIARGLDYVHRQRGPAGEPLNLVHRDVSPDNMFMVRDGTVKLLDFGVARGAATTVLTSKGELKGKVPFMSPEQIDGDDLDGRSDLFSLGVAAWTLLVGHRPFRGATAVAVMRAIQLEDPPPPRTLNAEVPLWLDELVMSLLAKDRAARPPTGAFVDEKIGELGRDLLDKDADAAFLAELLAGDDREEGRGGAGGDAPGPRPAVRRLRPAAPFGDDTAPTSLSALLEELAGTEPPRPLAGDAGFDDGPTELSVTLPVHGDEPSDN